MFANLALDVQLLLRTEPTLDPHRAACGLGCQRFEPISLRQLDRTARSVLTHAQRSGNLFERSPLPMQSNRLLSPLVLCLPRQLASVFFVHLRYLGTRTKKSTLICRINSATVQRLLADQSEPGQMLPVASALADGFSLSGMQPKLSLGRQGGRYTFRGRVDQHSVIGKLPTVDFPLLPEVEMLSIRLARLAGVETCECELVPMELLEDQGELPVATGAHFLAVSRFDRGANDRVHVEDFAQVFSVDPADKYRHITYLDIMRLMILNPAVTHSLPADFAAPKTADVG